MKDSYIIDRFDRNGVSLIPIETKNDAFIAYEYMDSTDVFYRQYDRLKASRAAYLIRYFDEVIGYTALVEEKENDNFLFLDTVIGEDYRCMGIGNYVCEVMSYTCLPHDPYLMVATRRSNHPAVKSVKGIGSLVFQKDCINYYLIQKDRLNEYFANNMNDLLLKHIEYGSEDEFVKCK